MLTFTKPGREPDFKDQFTGPNAHPEKSARQLAAYAIARSPLWFRLLFRIRQFLANLVGLRTDTEDGAPADVAFLLSLPVLRDDIDRYEAGLSDKHLDFSILIEKEGSVVHLATEIWFNHFSGRVYLFFVRPFHDRIVGHWVRALGERSA